MYAVNAAIIKMVAWCLVVRLCDCVIVGVYCIDYKICDHLSPVMLVVLVTCGVHFPHVL